MAYQDNLAYDLARFDRQARQRRTDSAEKTTEVDFTPAQQKSEARGEVRWSGTDKSIKKLRMSKLAKVFVTCLVMIAMLGTVVFNQAKLNEINREINTVGAQITKLKSENVQKQIELEQRVNIRTAEEVARNEYGMVNLTNAQITYIEVGGEEQSRRMDNSLLSRVKLFFEQISAYFSEQ